MRYQRIVLVLTVVALAWMPPVEAQSRGPEPIEARLRNAGVPVKHVEVRDAPAATLQVTLQSTSSTDQVAPEDPGYEHAVDRVLALALRDGLKLALVDLTIVNTAGQPIHWTLGMPVNRAFVERNYPAAEGAPGDLEERLRQALPLGGLKLDEAALARDADGWDEVTVRLSAPTLAAANVSVAGFMRGTLEQVETLNAAGHGQIAIVRVELVDGDGQLLLRHVRDYQLRQEHWWQAEGLARDWFPSPGGDPEAPSETQG